MTKKLSNMTDEELAQEADRLAEQRTEIREQQNAVAQEQEIRRALSSLSPETRRIVAIQLEGGLRPEGERNQEATSDAPA